MTAPPPADGMSPRPASRWAKFRHRAEVAAFAALGLLSGALAVFFTVRGAGVLRNVPGVWLRGLFVVLLAMSWTVPVFCGWSVAWRVKRGAGRDADRPLAPAARFTRRARGLMLAGLCAPPALLSAAGLWIFVDRLLDGVFDGTFAAPDPAAARDPAVWLAAGLTLLAGTACFLLPLAGLAAAARLLFGRAAGDGGAAAAGGVSGDGEPAPPAGRPTR